jgi:hypothetical protein
MSDEERDALVRQLIVATPEYAAAFRTFLVGDPLTDDEREVLEHGREDDGYRVPPHVDPTA